MTLKVIILGTGVSGIYSYFGALDAGYRKSEVEIWGRDFKVPAGAFFLHELPPRFHRFQREAVTFGLFGTAERYFYNQWGREGNESSALKYEGVHHFFNSNLLPVLLAQMNVKIVPAQWNDSSIQELSESREVDAVIQTFPTDPTILRLLQEIRIPIERKLCEIEGNYCFYNGLHSDSWVRRTIAFGYDNKEYPYFYDRSKLKNFVEVPDIPPWNKEYKVKEPRKGKILKTGRWALYDREFLSHQSYHQVKTFLEE